MSLRSLYKGHRKAQRESAKPMHLDSRAGSLKDTKKTHSLNPRHTRSQSATIPNLNLIPPTPPAAADPILRRTTVPVSHKAHRQARPLPYPATPPANLQTEQAQDYITSKMNGVSLVETEGYDSRRGSMDTNITTKRTSIVEAHEMIAELDGTELRAGSGKKTRPRSLINREDKLQQLKSFKTVFVIDDSASMYGEYWTQVSTLLRKIAEVVIRYTEDPRDGLDIIFLNSYQFNLHNVTSVDQVISTFRQIVPHGITPTANVLDIVLRGYLEQVHQLKAAGASLTEIWQTVKPMNVVILTDGEPTDEPEDVIVAIAKELDRLNAPLSQIGIQFVQIGDDEAVGEYLRDLDDALKDEYTIRDIVDTTPYRGKDITAEEILKILLGAVNRRLDRKPNMVRE